MIGLPDHRVLITQDLIYNAVHVFVGEQAFDSWGVALKTYRALPYERIFPAHGAPGGPELYDAMAHYLSVARRPSARERSGRFQTTADCGLPRLQRPSFARP
jgi:hypothetical protein